MHSLYGSKLPRPDCWTKNKKQSAHTCNSPRRCAARRDSRRSPVRRPCRRSTRCRRTCCSRPRGVPRASDTGASVCRRWTSCGPSRRCRDRLSWPRPRSRPGPGPGATRSPRPASRSRTACRRSAARNHLLDIERNFFPVILHYSLLRT